MGEAGQSVGAIVKQEHLDDSTDHSGWDSEHRLNWSHTTGTSEEFQKCPKSGNVDPEFLNALLTKHKHRGSNPSKKSVKEPNTSDPDLASIGLGAATFNPVTYVRGDRLYKKYEPHEKLQVLVYAQKYSNMKASRFFGIGESTIRGWAKTKMKILAKMHKQNLESPKENKFVQSLSEMIEQHTSDGGDVN